ncbi:ABC transporter permease [Georgenia sunbinii]|uniref:ABC transporter permease n=1 Tax=Georgenia sunbinii TaxID=3117728 RepID=UPI002F262663
MTTLTSHRTAPLADTLVMIRRSLRHAVREPEVILLGVALPVGIMLLITIVFGGALDTGGGAYVDYVVPGVLLLVGGYGAAQTAISVTKDVTEGIVARFRTMPMTPSAVLTGHVVASVLRNLVSLALSLATALAIGFRPTAGLAEWLGATGVIALYMLAVSWLSAAAGLVVKTVEGASAVSFALLFLPYLSSAFVPVSTLPSWLHGFAEHTPFTPIIETVRALLFGQPTAGHLGPALAWLTGLLAVGIVGSAVMWRRSARG